MSSNSQKSRRFLRFSLRTLLLLTAVVAVLLGVQVNKAQKQRAAVAAIEEAGGFVSFLQPVPDSRKPFIALLGDEYWREPLRIMLSASEVDDAMLEHLNNVPANSQLIVDETEAAKFAKLLPSLEVVGFDTGPPRIAPTE